MRRPCHVPLARLLATCVMLVQGRSGAAVEPYLVKNLDVVPPRDLVLRSAAAGDRAWLWLGESEVFDWKWERGLWVTDGTAEGTGLLHAGFVDNAWSPVVIAGNLWFPFLSEAWVSDGSAAGTRRLPRPPGVDSSTGTCGEWVLHGFGHRALVQVDDCTGDRQLWIADGKEQGTWVLNDVVRAGVVDLDSVVDGEDGETSFVAREEARATLWRSDGTPTGTFSLRSWDALSPPEAPVSLSRRGVAGERLFFTARDAESGEELWISDGTEGGTRRVMDLQPGTGSSRPEVVGTLGRRAFFAADDGVHGREVWVSDGTREGTSRIPGLPARFSSLTSLAQGGIAFVRGWSERRSAVDLWVTDGTTAGTVDLTPIVSMQDSYWQMQPLRNLMAVSIARGNLVDAWLSDGTTVGTAPLRGLVDGEGLAVLDLDSQSLGWSATSAGRLFFAADDGRHGAELWLTDGTPAGTRLVKDLVEGPSGSKPRLVTALDEHVLFTADDGVHGRELWSTDGTPEGTVLLRDFSPSRDDYLHPDRVPTAVLGESLVQVPFFESLLEPVVVASDGTLKGTVSVVPNWGLRPRWGGTARIGAHLPFPGPKRILVDTFRGGSEGTFFQGSWVLGEDPTDMAPLQDFVQSIVATERPIQVGPPAVLGQRLCWLGRDDACDSTLHVWDGSAQGLLSIPLPAPATGFVAGFDPPPGLQVSGGRLFFFLNSLGIVDSDCGGLWGLTPWTSDGTPEGTFPLEHLLGRQFYWFSSGTGTWAPPLPVLMARKLYFVADDEQHLRGLWVSDGTPESTVLVAEFDPGSFVQHLTVGEGRIYFDVGSPSNEDASVLWVSDGTPEGTQPLGIQRYGAANWPLIDRPSAPGTLLGDGLYFFARDEDHGWELRVVRGGGSAELVRDAWPGPGNAVLVDWWQPLPAFPLRFRSRLVFEANDGVHGTELWISDGTEAGTVPLREAVGQPDAWRARAPAVAGDRMFFAADDGLHGEELWTSDGTPEGTRLVGDVLPGPEGSSPDVLAAAGGRFYFWAADGRHGRELWAVPLDEQEPSGFRRGDSNADATLDMSDAIATLGFLFLGSQALSCLDAADANDSGEVDLLDAVFTLGYLFLGTAAPPEPFEACGPDEMADGLGCEAFEACR